MYGHLACPAPAFNHVHSLTYLCSALLCCLQASSNVPGNAAHVKALMSHASFNISNPNSCYSLFLGFARSPVNFHAGAHSYCLAERGSAESCDVETALFVAA